MQPHSFPVRRGLAAAVATAVASLAACGGGGGDGGGNGGGTVNEPAPTANVSTRVVDGPIRNALVCMDRNTNGACDEGEPSTRSGADGRATLVVPTADQGRFPLLAIIGTDAVDADTGPVASPFAMTAPADQPALINPLTTLVQQHARTTGASTADAERFVREQLALPGSVLADYSAASAGDAAAQAAAVVARLAALAMQQQAAAIAPAVGQRDASGATITRGDIDLAAARAVLELASALAGAVRDPAVAGASGAARDQALAARAREIVATQSDLTAQAAPALIGTDRLLQGQAPAPATGVAAATLRMLTFADPANWFWRANVATAADNTPDSQGRVRYYDERVRSVNGQVARWGFGLTPDRESDQLWNGSAWVRCPLGTRGVSTVRDAAGLSSFNFCDNYMTGTSRRAVTPIAGRSLASVYEEIRRFPGRDLGVAYADWGPPTAAAFGNAVFPAGSELVYQQQVNSAGAPAYLQSPVFAYGAPAASGGDARGGRNPVCNQVTATNAGSFGANANSLDTLIANMKGTPCVFDPGSDANGTSGERNEWWSNSTVDVGSVAGAAARPAGTGNYYTTTRNIRAAFTGTQASPNQVTFYDCRTRTRDGSIRNCDVASTGTYEVRTLGDARVLFLRGAPASAGALNYERIFVERGGSVFFGYSEKAGRSEQVRLNLAAANAVLSQLGIRTIVPE